MIADLIRALASGTSPAPPRLRIADRYADVLLTNQFGRKMKFRTDLVRGRAIVINTMFTTCRGSCPGTSRKVQALRDRLSPVFGAKLSFVSLTLEPEIDTPTKLREYAADYKADRESPKLSDWHFLTGSAANIEMVRRSVGLYDLNPKIDADPARHGSVLLFGNADADRWSVLPADLRTGLLVEAIRRTAGFTFEQRYGIRP